eukprot:Rhum_TRINITY_DN21634_c0_g1::Rhum_TRINITY_DN21634_c0_g1_i1::g.174354::m.174354
MPSYDSERSRSQRSRRSRRLPTTSPSSRSVASSARDPTTPADVSRSLRGRRRGDGGPVVSSPPPAAPNRLATVVVLHSATTLRLRNLDLETTTLRDLQRLAANYTQAKPALHFFRNAEGRLLTGHGRRGGLVDARRPLAQQGVRHGDELFLEVRCSLTVVHGDLEMRFHGMEPLSTLCAQLRRAVLARLNQGYAGGSLSPREVVLQSDETSFISLQADDMPLAALGVQEGDVLHAAYYDEVRAAGLREEKPTGGGGSGGGATRLTPLGSPQPFSYPQEAQRVARGEHAVPLSGTLQLFVAATGVWGDGGQQGSVSRFTLPAVRADSTLWEVRLLIYDLLGVVPDAQVLCCEGVPIAEPPQGVGGFSAARRLDDVEICTFVSNGETLELAPVDGAMPPALRSPPRLAAPGHAPTPWCVHCVVADGRVMTDPSKVYTAGWTPQFLHPSWTVEDLLAVLCLEANADSKLGSIFFRGAELHLQATVEECGLSEGSVVLVLLRPTMELSVDLLLPGGRSLHTLLCGVPPSATVHQVVDKALLACGGVEGASAEARRYAAFCDGVRLPLDSGVRACGVPHRATLQLTHEAAVSYARLPHASWGEGEGHFPATPATPRGGGGRRGGGGAANVQPGSAAAAAAVAAEQSWASRITRRPAGGGGARSPQSVTKQVSFVGSVPPAARLKQGSGRWPPPPQVP